MKFAVFFRNVNLGRANCPSKAQLEQAFLDAGAAEAASFLVNGTLVFSAPANRSAGVLKSAVQQLQQVCGLKEPAFLRRVDELAALVAADPFAGIEREQVYECCITFLSPRSPDLPALPLHSRRGDVAVLSCNGREAFSLSYKIGNTPGSPNALLEKTLALPATTRAWNTIVRLVARHA
ncbi:DUF1697 domain-containing protein [Tahibacter harae]|uniref:DUF1697 domain-containing protein n=1 Tax=Tahibacter harae TaxID=2963937 RepID=A0ABT1QQN4_9GAMM|nr:DUF1697 domain-containing protein [Tahibacter harae]MCQ4164609.1 DUF1697 domain-containing protein [Tahibacter harae]